MYSWPDHSRLERRCYFGGGGGSGATPAMPAPPPPPTTLTNTNVQMAKRDAQRQAANKKGILSTILGQPGAGSPYGPPAGKTPPGAGTNVVLGSG